MRWQTIVQIVFCVVMIFIIWNNFDGIKTDAKEIFYPVHNCTLAVVFDRFPKDDCEKLKSFCDGAARENICYWVPNTNPENGTYRWGAVCVCTFEVYQRYRIRPK